MIVGEGASVATWYLPKALLVGHSPFFTAALQGHFVEASTLRITLPEDDPSIFNTFVQWLLGYFKRIKGRPLSELAASWSLGDKLDCQKYQDHVMLHLMRHHRKNVVHPTTIKTAYDKTVPGSKLRLYLISTFLHDSNAEGIFPYSDDERQMFEELDEFARDVFKEILTRSRASFTDPWRDATPFLRGMSAMDVKVFKRLVADGTLD